VNQVLPLAEARFRAVQSRPVSRASLPPSCWSTEWHLLAPSQLRNRWGTITPASPRAHL